LSAEKPAGSLRIALQNRKLPDHPGVIRSALPTRKAGTPMAFSPLDASIIGIIVIGLAAVALILTLAVTALVSHGR
jgi:multisubunit Na+/H+ antiporter MnhC subunit